mgnify:CR=1 FL=1
MTEQLYGYRGKILRVDLTEGTTRVENPSPAIYRRYLGGTGLGVYYLLNELPPGTDPLARENVLIFMTSPTTGCKISGQGRHTAVTKSPLTGGLADSQCGGFWGAELKFAGWDGIIITERAEKPIYLEITDDEVLFHSAGELTGKSTGEAQDILQERHPKYRVLQCGPAGENLVRYANVSADLKNFHGRGGIGAVMGSKNLRALAVRGSDRRVEPADPEKLKDHSGWFARSVKDHPAISVHHELGTSKGIVPVSVAGMLPTYNFRDGSFDRVEQVGGEAMKEVIGDGTETCYACAVSCKRKVKGKRGDYEVTGKYGGPEYESLGLLGPNLGVDDIVAIGQSNELCNAYGLDTISSGATLSWAVECFEKDLLTLEDTGGIELTWNDPKTYHKLLGMIARREGFGDLLAEGSYRAGKSLGNGAEKYSMTSKKQEFPNHEPRGKWGVGLGYAVSPTGADHLQAAHDPWFDKPGDYSTEFNWVDLEDLSEIGVFEPVPTESLSAEKVRLFLYLQFIWGLHDVIDWCIFTTVPEFRAISLDRLTDIVRSVTGWRTSLFELLKAAERAWTMARAFNIREGLSASEDTLPDRMFEGLGTGALEGHGIDRREFEDAVATYYGMMGWDEKGIPRKEKLQELAVEWVWDHVNQVK